MLYGAVPLLIDTVAEPNVAQFWAEELVLLVSARPLLAIVTEFVPEHPLASVMLTVYVPAERFDAVVPAAPFDQLMLYGAVPLLMDTVAEPGVAQF